MTTLTPNQLSNEVDYKAMSKELRAEIASLKATLQALDQSINHGEHSYLQSKNSAQRVALARAYKRINNQRFTLRTIESLGRGLTVEEKRAAFASDPYARLVDPDEI